MGETDSLQALRHDVDWAGSRPQPDLKGAAGPAESEVEQCRVMEVHCAGRRSEDRLLQTVPEGSVDVAHLACGDTEQTRHLFDGSRLSSVEPKTQDENPLRALIEDAEVCTEILGDLRFE